jgi:GTP1/Obg family GTP-binding protein
MSQDKKVVSIKTKVVDKKTEETWALIEKAFVYQNKSFADIVKVFGVNRRTLENRAAKGEWPRKRREFQTEVVETSNTALRDKVDALVAQGEFIDQLANLGPILYNEILNASYDTMRNRVEAFKSLAEATDRVARLSRHVRGLKEGEASIKSKEEITGIKFSVEVENKPEIKPLGEDELA